MTPGFPRSVDQVHQIEITSKCNLRCVYCPSPKLDKPVEDGGFGRTKEFMTRENFERALEWVAHFRKIGTQGELAITGVGEALLHPEFLEFMALAREVMDDGLITFSTNGILLTDELAMALQPYGPAIYVSLHRPEKAKPAIDAAKRAGLFAGVNSSFATDAFDWAGALDWEVTAPEGVTCQFLRQGWCVVLADGRVATCCLDAAGGSAVGSIWDEIDTLQVSPWRDDKVGAGCDTCYQKVPELEELSLRPT